MSKRKIRELDQARQHLIIRDGVTVFPTQMKLAQFKIKLTRLARLHPLALAYRLALEIEDVNVKAKQYRGSRWELHYYGQRESLLIELVILCRRSSYRHGTRHEGSLNVLYFDLPHCAQLSWHVRDFPLIVPAYAQPWDGLRDATFSKIVTSVMHVYPEVLKGKQ